MPPGIYCTEGARKMGNALFWQYALCLGLVALAVRWLGKLKRALLRYAAGRGFRQKNRLT